jgi:hypothetical protein
LAKAELFLDRVLNAVATSPTSVRWLVVAAEPVTSLDVTSADMLAELDETLHAAGIELCFAEMKGKRGKRGQCGSAMPRSPAGGKPVRVIVSREPGIEPCRGAGNSPADA